MRDGSGNRGNDPGGVDDPVCRIGGPTVARRLAAALLAIPGERRPIRTGSHLMTCGATGWLFSPNKAPGWRPGVRARRAGLPGTPALLPESQTRRENVYLLWRSTVPASPDVDSESKTPRKLAIPTPMTSNNPPLPARGPGGANHPHPSLEPSGRQTECPRTCLTAPCASHYLMALVSLFL